LPLSQLEENRVVVAECELISGDSISANIYYSGNTIGANPAPIDTHDGYHFTLGLANVDSGFKFIQNKQNPFEFSIDKTTIKIEAGRSYRFSGRNQSENLFSNVLRVPDSILMGSIKITRNRSSSSESLVMDCEVVLDRGSSQYEFLHLVVEGRGNEKITYDFNDKARFYRSLKHRDGFLVNNKEMQSNVITFKIILPKDYPHENVIVKVGNVTDTYYYHNLFLSDNLSSSQFNPQNPATYPLNIESPQAIGILSAATFSEQVVVIN